MNICLVTKNFGIQYIDSIQYKPHKAATKSTIFRAIEYCLYNSDLNTPLYEKRRNILIKMAAIIKYCNKNKITKIDSNTISNYIKKTLV